MRNIFFSLMLMATTMVAAGPVSQTTALQVATNYWQQQTGAKAPIAFSECSEAAGLEEMYLFVAQEGKGFVIVAKDDVAWPILGFSDEEEFNPTNVSPEARYWLNGFAREISVAKKQKSPSSPQVQQQWTALINGDPIATKTADAVEALMTTRWNQSPNYNNLCPYDRRARDNAPTGCLATALAQVMRKWEYPTHGYGSHSYTYEGSIANPSWSFGTQSADFANTIYEWDSMPNYIMARTSDACINAIATLMYHTGVALDMNYDINGSGAYMLNENVTFDPSLGLSTDIAAENAIPRYFNYGWDEAALRQEYEDSVWIEMLKESIASGHPIPYGGFEFNAAGACISGHAFVFDGYDNTDKFHVNWGWGGSCNGYFPISALNPNGTQAGTFNDRQGAIIGMEPLWSHMKMSEDFSIFAVNDFATHPTTPLQYSFAVVNDGDSAFNGYVGIACYAADSTFLGWIKTPEAGYCAVGGTLSETNISSLQVGEGCYRAVVMSGKDTNHMMPVAGFDATNTATICYNDIAVPTIENAPKITVVTLGHNVSISASSPIEIAVCDMMGRVVNRAHGTNCTFSLPTKGIYLVRANNTTQKIVIW